MPLLGAAFSCINWHGHISYQHALSCLHHYLTYQIHQSSHSSLYHHGVSSHDIATLSPWCCILLGNCIIQHLRGGENFGSHEMLRIHHVSPSILSSSKKRTHSYFLSLLLMPTSRSANIQEMSTLMSTPVHLPLTVETTHKGTHIQEISVGRSACIQECPTTPTTTLA